MERQVIATAVTANLSFLPWVGVRLKRIGEEKGTAASQANGGRNPSFEFGPCVVVVVVASEVSFIIGPFFSFPASEVPEVQFISTAGVVCDADHLCVQPRSKSQCTTCVYSKRGLKSRMIE